MPDTFDRVIALDETIDVLQDTQPPVGSDAEHMQRLARHVRAIYCMCRREYGSDTNYGANHMPRWDGGETADGRNCKSVWPKAALAILQCNADPLDYVRAQFVGTLGHQVPKPNQLYNAEAVNRWQQHAEHKKEQIALKIASDHNQLKIQMIPLTVNLQWSTEKALNYVLRDPRSGVSPVMLYCTAEKAALPIAAQLYDAALHQYFVRAAEYDELLGDLIPERLRQEGWRLRNQLSA